MARLHTLNIDGWPRPGRRHVCSVLRLLLASTLMGAFLRAILFRGLLYRGAAIVRRLSGLGVSGLAGKRHQPRRGRAPTGRGVGAQSAGRHIVVDKIDLVVVVTRLQAHGTTGTADPQHRRRGCVGMAMVSVGGLRGPEATASGRRGGRREAGGLRLGDARRRNHRYNEHSDRWTQRPSKTGRKQCVRQAKEAGGRRGWRG